MIDYQTYCQIWHLAVEKKLTTRQIARELKLNRKTVRKWLKRDRFEKAQPPPRASKLDRFMMVWRRPGEEWHQRCLPHPDPYMTPTHPCHIKLPPSGRSPVCQKAAHSCPQLLRLYGLDRKWKMYGHSPDT